MKNQIIVLHFEAAGAQPKILPMTKREFLKKHAAKEFGETPNFIKPEASTTFENFVGFLVIQGAFVMPAIEPVPKLTLS